MPMLTLNNLSVNTISVFDPWTGHTITAAGEASTTAEVSVDSLQNMRAQLIELQGRTLPGGSDPAVVVSVTGSPADLFKELQSVGDVVIAAGTDNVITGGIIDGDLIVNTPAEVTLNGVIVTGAIAGTGTVVQNGGGYLGDRTVTTYTHNALKTA